jgi:hypothetical protein
MKLLTKITRILLATSVLALSVPAALADGLSLRPTRCGDGTVSIDQAPFSSKAVLKGRYTATIDVSASRAAYAGVNVKNPVNVAPFQKLTIYVKTGFLNNSSEVQLCFVELSAKRRTATSNVSLSKINFAISPDDATFLCGAD